MKILVALLVALGGIASPARAQLPVALRGCWELHTTPLGDADEAPSVFRLDSVLGVDVGDCGRPLVRTVTGPPRKAWVFAYWRRLSADSIAVVWSDGVSGMMLRLAVSGDTLSGFASTFSDAPGDRPKRADATATRVTCPPPDSSAFIRAVEATSAGLREVRLEMPSFSMEVGDSIFARGEGVSGDGQAMRPRVVWTSSDSSVITVDSSGLVRGRAAGSATLTVITRDARATRRIIVTPRTFRAMTVSAYRACGLSVPGTLYCWGAESAERPATRVPRPIRTPRNLVSLTAGFSHFCALDDLGRAFCWGDNDYGELGTGTFAKSATPAQVGGGITFAEMSAGSHFTCAVTRGGIAYCWGLNDAGELGAGGEPAG
ncbi:MAG: Ig-like domain-containing protein, partial [Gemmatimonadota bacterium]|nr:Ig-like domain-containing protein [Gemmatimonadota bacterium]